MKKVILGWVVGFLITAMLQFGVHSSRADSKTDPYVKLGMMMTPGGSFEATTNKVMGVAMKKGDTITTKSVSIDLDGLDSGMALRNKHMKEKYLEVAKFPKAEVVEVVGKDGEFQGKLKIRAKVVPVKGEYEIQDGFVIAKFKTTFKDCGIQSAKYMSVGVDDEVEVEARLKVTGN